MAGHLSELDAMAKTNEESLVYGKINRLSHEEIKKELHNRNLKTNGKISVLRNRLKEHFRARISRHPRPAYVRSYFSPPHPI